MQVMIKDEHLYRFTMLQQSQSNLFRVQSNAVLMESYSQLQLFSV